MSKLTHFKLGEHSTIFYDPTSGMKVLKNVPGKTVKAETAKIQAAKRAGHIVQINEEQYNQILGIAQNEEAETEKETVGTGDSERDGLLIRLKELGLKKKELKKFEDKSNDEILEYLEANEE